MYITHIFIIIIIIIIIKKGQWSTETTEPVHKYI